MATHEINGQPLTAFYYHKDGYKKVSGALYLPQDGGFILLEDENEVAQYIVHGSGVERMAEYNMRIHLENGIDEWEHWAMRVGHETAGEQPPPPPPPQYLPIEQVVPIGAK